MKKLLFSCMLLCLSLTAGAQPESYWRLYPKIGFNLSKFPSDEILVSATQGNYQLKSRFKQGFTAGAELSYERDVLSATLGLMYANRGTKYKDYTYESPTYQEKVSGLQYTLHYLEMPLMGGYEITRGLRLKAGVQLGYLLKARFMSSSITTIKEDQDHSTIEADETDIDVKDTFKKLDFSIPIGISYEFSNVVVEARYLIGVTTNSDLVKARNSSFVFTVGYGFDL